MEAKTEEEVQDLHRLATAIAANELMVMGKTMRTLVQAVTDARAREAGLMEDAAELHSINRRTAVLLHWRAASRRAHDTAAAASSMADRARVARFFARLRTRVGELKAVRANQAQIRAL